MGLSSSAAQWQWHQYAVNFLKCADGNIWEGMDGDCALDDSADAITASPYLSLMSPSTFYSHFNITQQACYYLKTPQEPHKGYMISHKTSWDTHYSVTPDHVKFKDCKL